MSQTTTVRRRLAAILAADIAGYSRLMGEDEAATVRDLKGHQAAVLPLVACGREQESARQAADTTGVAPAATVAPSADTVEHPHPRP